MTIQKQNLNINFAQGLDTKSDPKQVKPGRFLSLVNSTFNIINALTKRNGFGSLTSVDSSSTTLTKLNDNLIATGSNLYAYSADSDQWLNEGSVQPVDVISQPILRNSASQTGQDTAISDNGLCLLTYVEASVAYYQISDSRTGQVLVKKTAIGSTATNPRAYVLGSYFIITFMITVAAVPHLQFISISSSDLSNIGVATDISASVKSLTTGYDAVVANNSLYFVWNGNDGGGAVRLAYLSSSLVVSSPKIIATYVGDICHITTDSSQSTPIIWASFWNSTTNNAFSTALNQNLITILAPVQTITTTVITELTGLASASVLSLFYQVTNTYSFSATRTDFIKTVSLTQAGVLGSSSVLIRSVGLGSKAFYYNSVGYMLISYGGAFQPTYFLMDTLGNLIAKLAYSNGIGYLPTQVLPSVSVNGNLVQFSYLVKDLLVPVNKSQGVARVAGTYSQTGVSLATISINTSGQYSSEIASALHLTGGFLWMYDSVKPVEHGFHVWPEDIAATTATTGGLVTAQQYYYIFCYEWTDAQGNIHRSAPSTPAGVVTTGSTSLNTINVPTLRLTYKTGSNPVRLVGYRWSTAQQSYYQFTSITSPFLNDTTVDSVVVTDAQADSSILGNPLLYTTGSVVENIAAPACSASTMFKSRLFLVDAEDRNLIWYSKQVIETTPVETSDLLTIYVAPTSGAQFSTGPITALSALDDKLIIFKENAIYYITGTGPDNTGANNDFADPVFITATIGCSEPSSIVFIPQGLAFKSSKGIWLLGRDLSTTYIGDPVEQYNDNIVLSSVNVPDANEVRFTLDSNMTLAYNYFVGQWCSYTGIPGISSTIYNGLHTYLNKYGLIFQETPGKYLDGSNPVLMSFKTGWMNLAGLQGYERAYYFYLLGDFITPHEVQIQIAYDYATSPSQEVLIIPDNYTYSYGDDSSFGSVDYYGGSGNNEHWRVFFEQQRCQAFQITFSEVFDGSYNTIPGEGLNVSGINMVFGIKKGYAPILSKNSIG